MFKRRMVLPVSAQHRRTTKMKQQQVTGISPATLSVSPGQNASSWFIQAPNKYEEAEMKRAEKHEYSVSVVLSQIIEDI